MLEGETKGAAVVETEGVTLEVIVGVFGLLGADAKEASLSDTADFGVDGGALASK